MIALAKLLIALILVGATSLTNASLDEAALKEILQQAKDEMDMPGVRAAVRYPNGETHTVAVGLANVEENLPLDNEMVMPGGSTGKTFVAALTMLLVEEGKLSLDDRISKWIGNEPWYSQLPNADKLQVKHLLSHSAGLRDYPGRPGFLAKMVWRVLRHGSAYFEREELIAFTLKKDPLFPPGEGFKYTDIGYLVLGFVIESASGRDYYELLDEKILRPQRLTGIRPQNTSVIAGMPPGYQGKVPNLQEDGRMKLDPSSEWTGGGLVTTPLMLVEFLSNLATGQIVSQQSLAKMLEGEWQDPATPWHYGYGLFVYKGHSFGHGGMWVGYRTHMSHFQKSGITVAVQTNRDGDVDLISLVVRIEAAAR